MIGSIYSHNIESVTQNPFDELSIETFRLSSDLERWRDAATPFGEILSSVDMINWTSSTFDSHRFQILLSIQYYSTKLLIMAPLLTGFLTARRGLPGRELMALLSSAIPVIEDDYAATTELQSIIRSIVDTDPGFLDRNAAWWTCNFTCQFQFQF